MSKMHSVFHGLQSNKGLNESHKWLYRYGIASLKIESVRLRKDWMGYRILIRWNEHNSQEGKGKAKVPFWGTETSWVQRKLRMHSGINYIEILIEVSKVPQRSTIIMPSTIRRLKSWKL